MTHQILRFEWFSTQRDAIRVNKNLQLPEFRITSYESVKCDARRQAPLKVFNLSIFRKTGNFTCLEARFHLRRNIGYHLAKTYIPTAICVLFSWISVWLPEEFVEGRIFVALTYLLKQTLRVKSLLESF